MSLLRPCLVAFLARCAAVSLAIAVADAQVPPGSAIVGTFSTPANWGAAAAGKAGLFLVDPAGTVTSVAGLPGYLALTSPTNLPGPQGITAVAYRPEDGAIVVGTVATPGGPTGSNIELFLFYLNGSAVDPTRTRQVVVGNVTSTGGVTVTPIPDADPARIRILLQASQASGPVLAGPLNGHFFAIVDLSTSPPTFTLPPNPLGTATATGGGAAVDPTGTIVYYALTQNAPQPTRVASLYRWDLATNTACAIASWPGHWAGGATTCDDDGTVYVPTTDPATLTNYVHAVHPAGCAPAAVTTTLNPLLVATFGVALDRASATYLAVSSPNALNFPFAFQNTLCRIDPATGTGAVLAGGPGVWGSMGLGPAVHNAIDSYGVPTDRADHYWFETFPNPGPAGLPTLGNGSFSLTLRAAPNAPVASILGVSFGFASLNFLGCQILVDPGPVLLYSATGGLSVAIPLPVPGDPALLGLQATAQSLNLDSSGNWGSSRGLLITLL